MSKMGEIIHSKIISNNKVTYKILLDLEEAQKLKGHLKNIHLFTANLCTENSQINTRGNKGVTKYFKIPLNIRSRKKYYGTLLYQKLDTSTKVFYVYTIHKENNNR
ncbi:MAG: hypothetical protein OQK82_04730 [Candidatus Pacearchaeota archaeon]|nr:hypothetical protein [Candidatus Pacearchaeota archaeon]